MPHQRRLLFCFLLILLSAEIATINPNDYMDDITKCTSFQDTNNCVNVVLKTEEVQCCLVKISMLYIYPYSTTMCSVLNKPIKLLKERMEKESNKAIMKEAFGYVSYQMVPGMNNIKEIIDYTCIDGKWQMKYGFDTYTTEEIAILKGENHCLRYLFGKAFISKEECFNSTLLQSSLDAGLSCGYYQFDLTYSDGSTESLKSCGIFNSDSVEYGQLDSKSTEMMSSFINNNKDGNKIVLSYKVELSDKKGNNMVYDSTTGKVITNNFNKINISKCLLLLMVLLF